MVCGFGRISGWKKTERKTNWEMKRISRCLLFPEQGVMRRLARLEVSLEAASCNGTRNTRQPKTSSVGFSIGILITPALRSLFVVCSFGWEANSKSGVLEWQGT